MKKLNFLLLILISNNFLFSMEVEPKSLIPFMHCYQHQGQVDSACFNKAGTEVLTIESMGNNATFCIWANSEIFQRIKVRNDYCCGIASFNQAETRIIVSDHISGNVLIYARDKSGVYALFSDTFEGFVCFNKKETKIVTRSFDRGKLCIRDADTEKELFTVLYEYPFVSACFNEEETEVATMAKDGMLQVWDRNSAKELLRCKHDFPGLTGKSVSFNKQGTEILACGASPIVYVWDKENGKILMTLEHPNKVICARFNSQGNEICTMAIDGNIRVWDKKTGNIVATFPAGSFFVNSLEWSTDGTKIVAAVGNRAYIWSRYAQ